MESLKEGELVKGEIYYQGIKGGFEAVFTFDGPSEYHSISGPYYFLLNALSPYIHREYSMGYDDKEIRVATPEEKKKLLKLIYEVDPKFQYLGITNLLYEIY